MSTITTTITTCYRCGKILENKSNKHRWHLQRIFSLKYKDSTDWREQDYWILCYDCAQKLKNFLKSINN